MMIRRALEVDSEELREIFLREFSEGLPAPESSTIVVAEEGGQIVGLLTVQTVIHVEPLWIKESHRGRYIVPLLVGKVSELFPNLTKAFAYTTSEQVGRLLTHFGLEALPEWKIFRWRK